MKNLREILEFRRAVRDFDTAKPIDPEVVKGCLKEAQLTPTSSNMQLWEAYHITDPEMLKRLAKTCLSQSSAKTAPQMVVFVARQDLYRSRAKALFEFEKENVKRNSPPEKHEKRIKQWDGYCNKYLPIVYARFFGLLGILRKTIALGIGLFRPIMRQFSESEMRTVVHKSCGMVAQTFMLTMSEKGYDTCPLEGFDSRLVKKMLNLPCAAEINMVVTCGIRSEKGVWGDRFRVPFEEQYHRI